MKFPATAAVVFTATSAYAQISVLTGAVSNVSTSVGDLDNATTNFDIEAIKSSADTLISTIASGKDAVNASKLITLTDSLGLTGPIQQQNKDFSTLAADLKARRPEIEKANACRDVHSRIASINTGSLGLIEAIIAKLPQAAQAIARQVATGTTRVLNEAQYDFSEDNCKDSSPTSTTSASTTSASTTSASTTASTPSPTATESPDAADADSKQIPVGGIIGGVLGGVGAIGAIGLCVLVFVRRRGQQKPKQERQNAVELDASDPRAPLGNDYKEPCARDSEKKELCAESTAIHEAPENARYELE